MYARRVYEDLNLNSPHLNHARVRWHDSLFVIVHFNLTVIHLNVRFIERTLGFLHLLNEQI